MEVGQLLAPAKVEGREAPGQLRRRRRLEGSRPGAEEVQQARAPREPVPQGSEVPGAAPPKGQARQGAGHVALSLQDLAQAPAKVPPLPQPVDGVEPRIDPVRVQQGAGEA